MTDDEKRKQIADQYRLVAHLATSIAQVHTEIAPLIEAGFGPDILDMQGKNSARLMEILGDILNGMDAVDREADAWGDPIFEKAHEMYPDASEGISF